MHSCGVYYIADHLIAFLIELFPFAQRAKGITLFQFFGRSAGFFTTFVNPIGLHDIGWKWMITYCAWLAFEIVFIVSLQLLVILMISYLMQHSFVPNQPKLIVRQVLHVP